MEITGILKSKTEPEVLKKKDGSVVVGKNGQMSKLSFVILQEGQYGKLLCIDTFNNGVMQFVSETSPETELTLKIDVSSREYQGKWYTSVSCHNATADKSVNYSNRQTFNANQAPKNDAPPSSNEPDDLPF